MPRQHNLEDEQPLLMSSASPSPTFGAAAAAAAAGDSSEAEAPLYKRKPHRFLILLFLINLLNYLDRYTISGAVAQTNRVRTWPRRPSLPPHLPIQLPSPVGILTPLENAFHISDSEGGLLMTVFVVSYLLLSPVFGYLGDRFNRKLLIGVGVTFWCLFTFGGSFSQVQMGEGTFSHAFLLSWLATDAISQIKQPAVVCAADGVARACRYWRGQLRHHCPNHHRRHLQRGSRPMHGSRQLPVSSEHPPPQPVLQTPPLPSRFLAGRRSAP